MHHYGGNPAFAVEEGFDLRECRRTFGQRYLDSDLDIESVSVLMGHASTKTTESLYSRRRPIKAVESVKRA